MDITNIIRNLNEENNHRKYIFVETIILNTLEKHLAEQDKIFHRNYQTIHNNRFSSEYDGYAPEGFDNYNGATVIEIKLYSDKRMIKDFIRRHLKKFLKKEFEIKNLIVVTPLELSEKEKTEYVELAIQSNDIDNDINLYIWGVEDINSILFKYTEEVFNINKTFELFFNNKIFNSIKKNEDEWKIKRKELIDNLKNSYRKDDLVLFLGAGISRDAKIPTWDKLVSDLFVSLLTKKLGVFDIKLSNEEKKIIIDNLKKANGDSPLLQARYIRKGLESVFVDVLKEILYNDCQDSSSLLDEICQLCLPIRNGVGIKAIVTYNFDDLIEINFKRYRIKYKAIYRDFDVANRDEIGIYHVHGFLPRDDSQYEDISKSLLVFSEEGYHNLVLDPYNWSNLAQLNYLRENTCLLVGLSVTDPNLRRLLDIAMRKRESEECKHYVILKRNLISKYSRLDTNISVDNIKTFDIVNHDLQDEYFKELGLNVIWVNEYEEIPEILRMIKE